VEGTHAGVVCEKLHPVGRTHAGEVCGELSTVRGTFMLEQGHSVKGLPPEEEGAAETMCDELTVIPIPIPLRRSGGGGREMGVKQSQGRRDGWGEGVLRSGFISHYPTLI